MAGFFLKIISWLSETTFKRIDLLTLGIYGVLIGFGAWHHEPWSDEAFPWMIARDADWRTFLQILFTNQDRHPELFYFILRPFAQMGFPYATQAVLNISFALAASFIFLSRAPFSRIFRYLFLFSFFMIYEYSVITRTYMLSVLLIFIIAAFYPKRTTHPLGYAFLVSLLLHSDYMCFGLGVGLTVAFMIENWERLRNNRRFDAAFLIMMFSVLWILWLGRSAPADHAPEVGEVLPFHVKNLLTPFANAFFPFSNFASHPTSASGFAVVAGIMIVLLAFMSFLGKPLPAMILGFSLGNLLLVFTFLHAGDYRHHGFIFISVLFSFWIASFHSERTTKLFQKWEETFFFKYRRIKSGALTVIGLLSLLGLQSIFYVYVLETFFFFSGAKPMAEAIQTIAKDQKLLERGFVIVAKHRKSIGLMPYLPGVRFWNPCTGDYAQYYKVGRALAACDNMPFDQAIQKTKEHFGDLNKILFLFEEPLPFSSDEDYFYQQVVSVNNQNFEYQIFGYMYERFYLYRAYPLAALKALYEQNIKRKELSKARS